MKPKTFLFLLCLVLLAMTACTDAPRHPLRLHYDHPATRWEEALPLGNGRLGVMVYGGTADEELQLNEETVWGGSPHNNTNPLAAEHLDEIRRFLFEGRNEEAEALCGQYVSAQQANGMPYQTIGSLHLAFEGIDSVARYSRELSISDALATTHIESSGVTYTREVFTSFTDDVVVVRLTADKRHSLSFTASYASPMKGTEAGADLNSATLTLTGRGYDHEGIPGKVQFTTITQFMVKGGATSCTDDTFTVSDANEVTLFISTGTNFASYRDVSADCESVACHTLAAVTPARAGAPLGTRTYNQMKASHIKAYRTFFDRVQLSLGISRQALKTIDVRVEEYRENNDPQLVELYFQFGRYLLICCSQPGGQAANLQGIWNREPLAPWDGKYTSNINLEMNYWPAEVTALPEMYEPLLRLTREVAENGRASAAMYGCRGWTLHHNTDIWRSTGAVDGAAYGIWPTCNAWLCQQLYAPYLFSGVRAYLAEAGPVVKGACEFFIDFLTPEPTHGWMVVAPSFSPENRPHLPGRSFAVVAGTTMDSQLVRDLFTHSIAATEELGTDALFADTLRTLLDLLPPMQIGRWGQLQEWMDDWDDPADRHRHVSHLWGLYPGSQITSNGTPDLFKAARTSLLARGDASTGWSMGWKVCLWARLLDGDHALQLIREQLTPAIGHDGSQRGGTYPNLFDAHPPFQIDGNFGCCAGIAEMLVQSHEGFVRLLPALPSSWQNGRVSGLRCRGGFEITDLRWRDGQVERCTVKSHAGGALHILIDGTMLDIDTHTGESVIVR